MRRHLELLNWTRPQIGKRNATQLVFNQRQCWRIGWDCNTWFELLRKLGRIITRPVFHNYANGAE